jgi:hypothetical protein
MVMRLTSVPSYLHQKGLMSSWRAKAGNLNLEASPLFDWFGACNLRMMRVNLRGCIFASKPFLTATNKIKD